MVKSLKTVCADEPPEAPSGTVARPLMSTPKVGTAAKYNCAGANEYLVSTCQEVLRWSTISGNCPETSDDLDPIYSGNYELGRQDYKVEEEEEEEANNEEQGEVEEEQGEDNQGEEGEGEEEQEEDNQENEEEVEEEEEEVEEQVEGEETEVEQEDEKEEGTEEETNTGILDDNRQRYLH